MVTINKQALLNAMAAKGITSSKELAEKSGVSSVTISHYFAREGTQTQPESLFKLAEVLGIAPGDLITV